MDNNTQVSNSEPKSQAPTQANNVAVDYDKIESMVNKGIQSKENAVLKSYFEQQGLSEDEVKAAIGAYKQDKANKAHEKETAFETMKAENETLKAQIRENALNNKAIAMALDMGVDRATAPYLVKMADLSKAVNESGEVDESAVKTAFETVLKDVPALKNSANNGFVTVGADGSKQEQAGSDDELRKLFGLKPKK